MLSSVLYEVQNLVLLEVNFFQKIWRIILLQMFGPLVPGTIGNGGGIPCIKHARTSVGLLIKLYPVSQIQYLFGLLRRLNIVGYQFIPFISRRQEDIKSRICFGNSSRNRRRKPAAFMDCLLLKYFYIFVTKMSLGSVSSVATALSFKVFIDIPCFCQFVSPVFSPFIVFGVSWSW